MKIRNISAGLLAAMLGIPSFCSGNAGDGSYPSGYRCPRTDIFADILERVPYRAMLPVYVGGTYMGGGDHGRIPAGSSHRSVCSCKNSLGMPEHGLVVGLWEVAYIIEITREPGCSPVLGTVLPVPERQVGSSGTGDFGTSDISLYHAHLYSFPLNTMLDLYTDLNCGRSEYMDFDLLYASEFDPGWYDESLSLTSTPEITAVADAAAVTACSADASLAYAGGISEELFYCAGAWGYLYPLSGYMNSSGSVAENTSLAAARVLALMHRRGLIRTTSGDGALCSSSSVLTSMQKGMYRFSMLYPVAESQDNHAFGAPVEFWRGDSRVPPGFHDAVYLVWRYRNCCLGAGG